MSPSPAMTIDQQLLQAQVAIDNALNDADLLAALSLFGYNETRLNEGKALYTGTQTLVNRQKAEYGDQFQASADFNAAWQTANDAYMRSLKVARVAFKQNPGAKTALMLTGDRKRSLSGWLEQTQAFYSNLLSNANLLADIGQFGYDEAKLSAEQALVTAVHNANLTHEKEKGEAQTATQDRDAQLDALNEWLADFKAIAEVALADKPQWLEKLGFGAVA